MKRILILSLLLCMITSSAFGYGSNNYEEFGEYKSKYRILYGLLLVVGGGALAYDGFRTVKIDISKPNTAINQGGIWYNNNVGSFVLFSSGTIANTGNVNINKMTFEVRYKRTNDYFPEQNVNDPRPVGYAVAFDSTGSAQLTGFNMGDSVRWTQNSMELAAMANPPFGNEYIWYDGDQLVEYVNVKYWSYDHKYKMEINNVYEGIAGALLLAGGIYILVDYIVSLKRFDYYMKKHSLDFYVENCSDEFRLKMTKRI